MCTLSVQVFVFNCVQLIVPDFEKLRNPKKSTAVRSSSSEASPVRYSRHTMNCHFDLQINKYMSQLMRLWYYIT